MNYPVLYLGNNVTLDDNTGILDMSTTSIRVSSSPDSSFNLVNKEYVDLQFETKAAAQNTLVSIQTQLDNLIAVDNSFNDITLDLQDQISDKQIQIDILENSKLGLVKYQSDYNKIVRNLNNAVGVISDLSQQLDALYMALYNQHRDTEPNPSGQTGLNYFNRYEYDENGNVIQYDANGNRIYVQYDGNGNMIGITGSTGP